MTVLVTGGAGYIGSHMVWRLLDAGEKVVVVDRLSTGFNWAVPKEANLIVCDIGEQDRIEAVLREHDVQSVFHFAGSIVVPDSVADPLGYYLNNTVKSRTLIEACVNAGVSQFIFSSTAAVYGTPDGVEPVSEDAATRPESPYGTSKLMTELMLRDTAAAYPMNYACLRYFNVAGADPDGRTGQSTLDATHLIKVATQTALGKRSGMQIFGDDYPTEDGTCIRDYIHVSDLIEAHYLALLHLRKTGENLVANCGYGHGLSVLQVIDAVKRISGSDFKVQMAGRRAGDAISIVANSDHIKQQLDWRPRYDDLDQIVTHALDWEKALDRRNN
ncbi:UDP-glucose 4-epimerase GalE [Hoeflea sp. TYP-13]|uniref:UDP-glucose 4-epimerase GalE n=1 Tax=Hoeflea sp. TYP-13 TaxID=3230023 RepID=UPI0034C5F537